MDVNDPKFDVADEVLTTDVVDQLFHELNVGLAVPLTWPQLEWMIRQVQRRSKSRPKHREYWLKSLKTFLIDIEEEVKQFLLLEAQTLIRNGVADGDVRENLKRLERAYRKIND